MTHTHINCQEPNENFEILNYEAQNICTILNHKNYVTYNVAIAKKLGSINAAILLCKLIDFYEYLKDKDQLVTHEKYGNELFYFTVDSMYEKTAMTERNQSTAISILESYGIIKKFNFGLPNKRYFKIIGKKLIEFFNSIKNNSTKSDETSELDLHKEKKEEGEQVFAQNCGKIFHNTPPTCGTSSDETSELDPTKRRNYTVYNKYPKEIPNNLSDPPIGKKEEYVSPTSIPIPSAELKISPDKPAYLDPGILRFVQQVIEVIQKYNPSTQRKKYNEVALATSAVELLKERDVEEALKVITYAAQHNTISKQHRGWRQLLLGVNPIATLIPNYDYIVGDMTAKKTSGYRDGSNQDLVNKSLEKFLNK